ncbi:hypothetical protein AYI70_g4434 [Smittium culicis]|uniref:Uncharacterized protein n=1 Tax=Smittium culicis TaxID=133412 RepID=A0A1R1XZ22_9FUNG|nr:hypothetical protein AYI70_g4434 [Smittium culicis]
MVKQLLRERKQNSEPEDPFISTRIPITDLAVYPELIEALPSMEDDFFRTPLSEEERKEAIHSCPRSDSMNYQPPPLNDLVPAAVKKADACLRGIQIALAQATRPVDYYVHRIVQDNPSVREDNPHINFANAMRALLADIVSTVTQGRLDNLHKGMDLPGKPQQLIDSDTKPLMDQENLDALIASKKPEKRSRIRKPFRGRQQFGTQNSTGSNTAQSQTMEAAVPSATVRDLNIFIDRTPSWGTPRNISIRVDQADEQGLGPKYFREGVPDPIQKTGIEQQGLRGELSKPASTKRLEMFDEESAASPKNNSIGAATVEVTSNTQQDISTIQESHRGSQKLKSGLLQQPVCHSKENRGNQTSPGFDEAELKCGAKELQNGNIDVDILPVPRTTVWSITKPEYVYQGTETTIGMGTVTGSAEVCNSNTSRIYTKLIELGYRIKEEKSSTTPESSYYASRDANKFKRNDSESSIFKGQGPTTRSQQAVKHLKGHREGIGEFYRESTGNINGPVAWTINATKTFRTEKHRTLDAEILDSCSYAHGTSDSEFEILEGATGQMEWPVIYTRDTRTGNLYRFQHQFYGSEFSGIQLEGLEEPICVSPMELDITSNTEGQTEQTDNNSDNNTMETRDLVPRPSQPIDFPAATSTSNSGSTRPQKRKIPAVGEQKLESDGMEDQRRALQAQGLSNLAIEIFISNERCRKCKF